MRIGDTVTAICTVRDVSPRSAVWFSTASARSAIRPLSKVKPRDGAGEGLIAPDAHFPPLSDVHDGSKGAVVAVGNFDGVHRGHQALIGEARQLRRT